MNFTFLTEEQIQKLDIFVKMAYPTDLTILLGGRNFGDFGGISFWSASATSDYKVLCHDGNGETSVAPTDRNISVRPVLPASEVSKISLMENSDSRLVKYGEFPQTIVEDNISKKLEKLLHSRKGLNSTGKSYTFNTEGNKGVSYPEYEMDGKRYIRISASEDCEKNEGVSLSNGQTLNPGKPYWVEVQPIEWMIDSNGMMIAKKCLFSGIPFDTKDAYDGDFSKTSIKEYMDTCFAKEMECLVDSKSIAHDYEEEEDFVGDLMDVSVSKKTMSNKDQIDFLIQNSFSFMLHGPSGVGKSRRVKEFDPDLSSITLCNGIMPEEVIGRMCYSQTPPDWYKAAYEYLKQNDKNMTEEDKKKSFEELKKKLKNANGAGVNDTSSGVWKAPKWYTDLCEKCENEPNKKHILFIDEVTNAKETTQSLIYHIVLERSIALGVGKLPKNAVVVLAGNNKEESSAAYTMPEPLYRRLTHINLDLNIPDWLEWGAQPNPNHPERLNIHPIVASFVASHGMKAFYSQYDEQEPQQFALDPRKWEMVSNKIYASNGKIRPEVLKADIGSDMTASFIAHVKNPPLSLEEVLEGQYDAKDIPKNTDACLALALSLTHVSEDQIEKVRQFIKTYFNEEICATFDSHWVGDNDERLGILAALDECEEQSLPPSVGRVISRQEKYGVDVVEAPMSDKDHIDFLFQNGFSFMLHGKSGIGKSQRVKEIDPDLTSLTLCNGMMPEDVIGRTFYDTEGSASTWGAPGWYTKLGEKCKNEPNKKHVLFIDEVTNARETTQSMIYHIVLDRSISPGVGKLPENAVVVLAGNSKEESSASYNMPAPLFRRLSHIYLDLNMTDWLEWGSERDPNNPERLNIHPLVANFVATRGQGVFYTPYDEEDPTPPVLDPRRWKIVSDKLYAAQEVCSNLFASDIGQNLENRLLEHINKPHISLKRVLKDDYTKDDIPIGEDACLALVLRMRYVSEKNVDKVRQFIDTNMGDYPKVRELFDATWEKNPWAQPLNCENNCDMMKKAMVNQRINRGR